MSDLPYEEEEIEVQNKPGIIDQDLVEQFNTIEQWVEEEKEQKGVIQNNLNTLYTHYRVLLESAIMENDLDEVRKQKVIIESSLPRRFRVSASRFKNH